MQWAILRRAAASIVVLTALVTILTGSLFAQAGGPGPGNRKIHGIAIRPTSIPGNQLVSVLWTAAVSGPLTAGSDWSATVQLSVNGTVVTNTDQTAIALFATDCSLPVGGCNPASCGMWDNGIELVDAFCREVTSPTGPTCECAAKFITTLPSAPIAPGDQILVSLVPTAGSQPESDPTDDSWSQTYSGPVAGPNRSMQSVSLLPASGGITTVQVQYHVESGPSSTSLDLSTGVRILRNGNVVSDELRTLSKDEEIGSCENNACPNMQSCANWQCPPITGIAGQCMDSNTQNNCACTIVIDAEVPGVPFFSGDNYVVVLYPAPGAWPDLPGLADDNSGTPPPPVAPGERNLLGIATRPGVAPGTQRVFAIWEALAEDSSNSQDFSANVDLFVNTLPVASTTQTAIALNANSCEQFGGCLSGVCGTWDNGATVLDGYCRDLTGGVGPPICRCAQYFFTELPEVLLTPGDNITVTLTPALGALPEATPTNDQWNQTYTGPIAGPNRSFQTITLTTILSGPTNIQIQYHVESGPSSSALDLSTRIQVLRNGNVVLDDEVRTISKDPEFGTCENNACLNQQSCANWQCPPNPNVAGQCLDSNTQGNCACTIVIDHQLPNVLLSPGDTIEVVLSAAEGALPDLPDGFAVDDIGVSEPVPTGNRRIAGIATRPGPAGTQQVFVIWEGVVPQSLLDRNLDTGIELLVNGTVVGSTVQTALSLGADDCTLGVNCSTGICGSWDDGTTIGDGFCRDVSDGSGTAECRCGYWFITALPPTPLVPGDDIMVNLYPAAGSIPDADVTDDSWVQTYSGPIAGPNRAFMSAQFTPDTGGPGVSSLHIDYRVESGPSSIPLDFGTRILVLVNTGTGYDELRALVKEEEFGTCDGSACVNQLSCGNWDCPPIFSGVAGQCFESPMQNNCTCAILLSLDIDDLPATAGDDITVIFSPAPGALPELPGFDPDDSGQPEPSEQTFVRGDCNADGSYDIGDAISILGELFSGQTPGPCTDACDTNDDGGKDIGDAVFTLASLFSGGPFPPIPHPACGPDPTGDTLGCASFPPCP